MDIAADLAPQPHPIVTHTEPPVHDKSPVPRSPTRAPITTTATSKRHTKGLSLNFPILLPTNAQISPSPIGSGGPSLIDSARSSPRMRVAPFRSPDVSAEGHDKSKARGSGEFLTLLAAQERKVLELKEELQRAETDLSTSKKQWAAYEANKKRGEVQQVKKHQPVALDDVGSGELVVREENVEEERNRKRALVERSYANPATATTTTIGGSGLARKGSKRVFEGGRHTRTLSLLSPTTTKPNTRQAEDTRPIQDDTAQADVEDDRRMSMSRMPTLDSLMSGEALPLGFGKTYKDLAAHRRSLPPVAADLLVKQSKQVYDGVKDGLWTFFEDIRQATVGEEGINGTVAQHRPVKHPQRKASRKASENSGKSKARNSVETSRTGSKEPSFWNEFGLETPQRKGQPSSSAAEKSNGHVQQKSSTDSSKPPSLLPDLNDSEDVEDGWDAWDSPSSNKSPSNAVGVDPDRGAGSDEGGLPWPEIQRVTPKLTRTISDLMKEWDSSQTDLAGGNGSRESQTHILDSPHI